jgi:hypothetical protein
MSGLLKYRAAFADLKPNETSPLLLFPQVLGILDARPRLDITTSSACTATVPSE